MAADDFEGERCIGCPVAGDFDGQRAATGHSRLYQQVVGCGAVDLLAGVGEGDRRILHGGEGIEAVDSAEHQDGQVQGVAT